MNAPSARLDAILDLLPSLNSPTVASLRDPAWLSLETVVDADLVRDLIPACAPRAPKAYSNTR